MRVSIALGMLLMMCSLAAHANEVPALVYKDFPIAKESSPDVFALIDRASGLVYPEPREARRLIIEALTKVDNGARIGEYEYLWALYGLVKSSHETNSSTFGPGTREDYIKLARKTVTYLDQSVKNWDSTPDRSFKTKVYKEAGNGLAWYLYEDAKGDQKRLGEALSVIQRAEPLMDGWSDYFILDTKVRILLALGRQEEAFKIVREVLEDDPDFADFSDLRQNPAYLSWLKQRKADQPAKKNS